MNKTSILLGLAALGAHAAVPAATNCAALKELKVAGTRITLAQAITPNPSWALPPSLFTTFMGPGKGVTAPFCRVAGVIEKEIHFELWLPRDWNGRFEGVGNGGLSGALNYPAMAPELAKGFATASTDTGHTTDKNMFQSDWIAGHPQRVLDFGYRGHHLLADRAKTIVAAYYGKPAAHAYYSGCSSGGWQGLTEAQKYPGDYDGIVAGAPAINFVRLQLRGVLLAQHDLAQPQGKLPKSKIDLLVSAAVARCDVGDGVKDGVIDNPPRCNFDPGQLLCTNGDNDRCLTAAQVNTARFLYGPMTSPKGLKLYPGPAYGAPALPVLPGAAANQAADETAIVLMAANKPAWDVASFDPDRDVAPLEKELGGLLDSNDPNLEPFIKRGGKLLLYHGWADNLLSPYDTIDYYQSVARSVGPKQAREFMRLFMEPGMAHCRGGPGPNVFDPVDAMVEWVEHGVAPEQMVAAHLSAGKVDRTRPLCAYPKVAKYSGSGSTNEAANFRCEAL